VTAFDQWYAVHVEANLPKDFPPQFRAAGKAEAAKVWNAAIRECISILLHPGKIELEKLLVKNS
jgi:hypothetical protein